MSKPHLHHISILLAQTRVLFGVPWEGLRDTGGRVTEAPPLLFDAGSVGCKEQST
jgi:hypothetical protein